MRMQVSEAYTSSHHIFKVSLSPHPHPTTQKSPLWLWALLWSLQSYHPLTGRWAALCLSPPEHVPHQWAVLCHQGLPPHPVPVQSDTE